VPYAQSLVDHIQSNEKQSTSASSKFLDACRSFASDKPISRDELIAKTVKLGFNNVIDAFHIVNQGEIPVRFFDDLRKGPKKGLLIRDEMLRLRESIQFGNLPDEVESRWRLVETAWTLKVGARPLEIEYTPKDGLLKSRHLRRPAITSCRGALNGYQKGKCFFCFSDIGIESGNPNTAEVGHFFPRVLTGFGARANLDGIWNLVLLCQKCNRGEGGQHARVPVIRLLARLQTRNDYLIESHHPLRETLISQTGMTAIGRREFLQKMDAWAIDKLVQRWEPVAESEEHF
jgi:hypothetical protein